MASGILSHLTGLALFQLFSGPGVLVPLLLVKPSKSKLMSHLQEATAGPCPSSLLVPAHFLCVSPVLWTTLHFVCPLSVPQDGQLLEGENSDSRLCPQHPAEGDDML